MSKENLEKQVHDFNAEINDLVKWTSENHSSTDWGEKFKRMTDLIRHRRFLQQQLTALGTLTSTNSK